jgi:ABC-2 type transport system ATP-binding protein
MLNLLEVLAARPGKSLLLASHLLGDIERVCDTAIIVRQGQVVKVGRIDELRAKDHGAYRLRWDGEPTAFLARLAGLGVRVALNGKANQARAIVPQGWTTSTFFAAAQQASIQLTGLEPDEEDLQSVYHRLITAPVDVAGTEPHTSGSFEASS